MGGDNSSEVKTRVLQAVLVPGSETPIEDGNNNPSKCLIQLEDGSLKAAIMKRIPQPGLSIEIFCSLILRNWGLRVPQPVLISDASGGLIFGSLDEGYPNLKRRLDFDDELPPDVRHELRLKAAALVTEFSQTPLAIAADEAIYNRDRHLANILWDGTDAAWIDHEGCLGNSDEPDQNRLASLVSLLGGYESVRDSAMHSAALLPTAPSMNIPEGLSSSAESGIDLTSKLTEGLERLSQRVLLRFPQPPDLFSQPTQK